MKKYSTQLALSVLLIAGGSSVLAEDHQHYLSVVPGGTGVVKAISKPSATASAAAPAAAKAPASAQKAAPADANSNGANQADQSSDTPPQSPTDLGTGETAPPARNFYSAALDQAVKQYKAAPSPTAYSQILGALKSLLAGNLSLRVSPTLIVKDNPYLNDFKPRVIDSYGVRIWSFPKAPERSRVLVQWFDVHQQVVGVGRRKKVVSSSTVRLQELAFPKPILVKDGGVVNSKDSGRHLVLAGDAEDGSLALQCYKMGEAGWQDSPEFLAQIPSFLTTNVSGRIAFKGNDLLFNIGKMVQTTDASGAKRLMPEAESATYRFWLKTTDAGFAVASTIPDEDSFSAVYQFMQAIQGGRTDVAKSLLVDPHLVCLPRYLGLQGKSIDASAKVVEMSMPPGRGMRFRLIGIGKDDMIFDVGKYKGQWQIKAIFIAAPDQFLSETSRYFPLYSRFGQAKEAEPKDSDAAAGGGGGTSSAIKKK